jgi:hypothetical protein
MKLNADPKFSSFIKYAPRQIKHDNFNSKPSQIKENNRIYYDKKTEENYNEIYNEDMNFKQTQDFRPDIKINKNGSHIGRNNSMRNSKELSKNSSTDRIDFTYIKGIPLQNIGKKLPKANSSIISTGEDTQRSRYTSKDKYSKKSSPNPRVNPTNYFPSDNKFLKMKIPKVGNVKKTINSKDCLTSRPSSQNVNSISTCSGSTLNVTIKNSTLRLIYNKEEEVNKSRNDKLKLIEKKSDILYKKKTFNTDNETREKVKNEIEQIKMKKELENCTFKPKIHRNSISAFCSRTSSPVMTNHNSVRDISLGIGGNTYDKQMEWKTKIKSR